MKLKPEKLPSEHKIPPRPLPEEQDDAYEDGPIPDLPMSHDPLGSPGPTPPEPGKRPNREAQ